MRLTTDFGAGGRHFSVDPEHPLRTWRVDDTRCLSFGVGRLWIHAEWPPREQPPEPGEYKPTRMAQLRIEWRRVARNG